MLALHTPLRNSSPGKRRPDIETPEEPEREDDRELPIDFDGDDDPEIPDEERVIDVPS